VFCIKKVTAGRLLFRGRGNAVEEQRKNDLVYLGEQGGGKSPVLYLGGGGGYNLRENATARERGIKKGRGGVVTCSGKKKATPSDKINWG